LSHGRAVASFSQKGGAVEDDGKLYHATQGGSGERKAPDDAEFDGSPGLISREFLGSWGRQAVEQQGSARQVFEIPKSLATIHSAHFRAGFQRHATG
jgi:hypothetical protein